MFFGGAPGILFQFEAVLETFDFCLQIFDDDLVFNVDSCLVVLLAAREAAVELLQDGAGLTVEVGYLGVLDVDTRLVSLGYAVDHSVKVGAWLVGGGRGGAWDR
jgi:hypothetical protein